VRVSFSCSTGKTVSLSRSRLAVFILERVVMDVDCPPIDWTTLHVPASSHDDDAVATGINAKVDKLLPDAIKEESLEQETDDGDGSDYTEEEYPSTIESDYTEEEYPSEPDEDEDDEYEYEDSEEQVIELEESKQVATVTNIPQMKEEHITVPSSVSLQDEDWESDDSESSSDTERPTKDAWLASWNKKDPRELTTQISVYAYFRKKHRDGGYGVILRHMAGKPIVASAKHSAEGKSFFYQVLMGIKAGVELADRRDLSDLSVRCNSIKVPDIIVHTRGCCDDKCKESNEVENLCWVCEGYLTGYEGSNLGLFSLIQFLKRRKDIPVEGFPRVSIVAAYYLAKRAMKNNSGDEDLSEIEPDAFPVELKEILWDDVTGLVSHHHRMVPWY
ncbi:hypothetical protein MKX01_019002, partial [Papaver californicum]